MLLIIQSGKRHCTNSLITLIFFFEVKRWATGWMIGVQDPAGAGNFSLHQPAPYPMGNRGFSLGTKRPGREADHSPPSSAEVKNAWSYTSALPIRLHGVELFIFTSTGSKH
jgi:hypothetical protein